MLHLLLHHQNWFQQKYILSTVIRIQSGRWL